MQLSRRFTVFAGATVFTGATVLAGATILAGAAGAWLASTPLVAQEQRQIDFSRDIRPILADKCFHCHGPDESARESDFRIDTRAGAFAENDGAERDGQAAIVPGSLEKSEIVRRICSTDEDVRMPPADSGKQLTDQEIQAIRSWIEAGAPWQEHWSFISPSKPEIPNVGLTEWCRNEIDHFVLATLESEDLEPSPEADRRTLVRRLYLDLIGMPPTRDEVHAFLSDNSSQAYERLVDRLLRSPHYGERMAAVWLDGARYADTNGYSIDGGRHMWLWRDWIIHAYNENMPYDQFVVEQLAGDLIPNATASQKVATGFNRNHMITHEGGTIPEENLVNYTVDRVATTSQVFLGLTMRCAQCHQHKFDPISQRDYYRFFAYFNTLSDYGLDGDGGVNAGPKIEAKTILPGTAVEQLETELARLKQELNSPHPSRADWEEQTRTQLKRRARDLRLHSVDVLKVTSPNRDDPWDVLEDGTIFVPESAGRSPSIATKIDQENVTGLRLEFLPDARVSGGKIGHGQQEGFEGGFILTSFTVSATARPSDQVDLYKELPIRQVTASHSHADYPAQDCLDPRDHNGWSPSPRNSEAQHITFTFDQPVHASETPYVSMMLVWGGGGKGRQLTAGKYRVYAMTGTDDGTNVPEDIQQILRIVTASRNAEQTARMQEYFASTAPELAPLRQRIETLQDDLHHMSQPDSVMVMDTAETPRETYILARGQYDQPTEKVEPGVPASLPPLPAGAEPNRLGLAKWLVQNDHPLTARVAVNRYWHMLFARGLVETLEDFGSQGQPPSHPKLLDWLAVDFVESGWDVQAAIKRIVMSATYRQSSVVSGRLVTETLATRDPKNRLLARGPRHRLQAEFIRDSVLKISGLMADHIGGPSVRPYQPAGLWREVSHYGSTPATAQAFVQDHGEKLYRRGIYTFWKRTIPPPSLVSFDAPNRELCTMRRSTTNTPLQALVLLNDPQYVEASRAFAERILLEAPPTRDERLRFAFEAATARLPTEQELVVLRRTIQHETAAFRADPDAAEALLRVGESPRNQSIDHVEHAAWTVTASVILNLSETITKR